MPLSHVQERVVLCLCTGKRDMKLWSQTGDGWLITDVSYGKWYNIRADSFLHKSILNYRLLYLWVLTAASTIWTQHSRLIKLWCDYCMGEMDSTGTISIQPELQTLPHAQAQHVCSIKTSKWRNNIRRRWLGLLLLGIQVLPPGTKTSMCVFLMIFYWHETVRLRVKQVKHNVSQVYS